MRAAEFISELQRISKSGYEGGKEAMRHEYGAEKVVRPLPGGSGLLYSITDGGGDYEIKIWDPRVKEFTPTEPPVKYSWQMQREYKQRLDIWKQREELRKAEFARSPGHIVGKLSVELLGRDFPIPGAVQVGTITVDEDYRGQGIATALYGIVLTIMKRVLVAGSSQTPGGRRNWASLSQIPGVELKGYLMIRGYDIDPSGLARSWHLDSEIAAADQNIDTIMGKLGGQYIGFDRPNDVHYFAFDVQPTTTGKELEAYVDTKLNTLYTRNYRSDGAGLFAMWTGR